MVFTMIALSLNLFFRHFPSEECRVAFFIVQSQSVLADFDPGRFQGLLELGAPKPLQMRLGRSFLVGVEQWTLFFGVLPVCF